MEPPNTRIRNQNISKLDIPLIYLHILKQGPSLKRLGLIFRANNDDIVSVRFEEMEASHRFELQSETKQDNHQQSTKLRKCLSRSRCRR